MGVHHVALVSSYLTTTSQDVVNPTSYAEEENVEMALSPLLDDNPAHIWLPFQPTKIPHLHVLSPTTSESSWSPAILVKLSCFIFKYGSKSAKERYFKFYVAIAKGIHLVVEL